MSPKIIVVGEPVKSAAFSPDDAVIAVLSSKGITLFDASSGARLRHVDAALTKDGSLENLLWIRPDTLVTWRFDAIQVVTLEGDRAQVRPVPCDDVQAVAASPEGDALLVVDGAEARARVVSLGTLESRTIRKLDRLPVASWSKEGIALFCQVDGKPGRAELFTPAGEVVVKLATPKWEQVGAVGVIDGALAAVVNNREIHRIRAGEKKATVTEVERDVDPAVLRGDLRLAVFCDDVCTLPDGELLGSLPEGWLTTVLSHDGSRALLSDPDRAEFAVAEVPQPKKRAKEKEAKAAPRPGLDERAWALVVYGVGVDEVPGERVAAIAAEVAAIAPGAIAVIDGMVEEGLFERLFAGVLVASTSKALAQRASAQAVEIGDAECKAAREKFAAIRGELLAALGRHDLAAEEDPRFYLLQAGPNASATLTAKKGSTLREVEEEGEKARKKVEVSYDATLSTCVQITGPVTLTVAYL